MYLSRDMRCIGRTILIPLFTTNNLWLNSDILFFKPVFYIRGGITVLTENGEETRSHLIIKNARGTDSGNYTCKPSIFKTATVRLHVLQGKCRCFLLYFSD